jgi:uncharacterized membrane protein
MRPAIARLRDDYPAGVGLAALYLFTLISLFGFATFGLHPSLLARFPQLAGFYASSFSFFAQAQIWLAWSVLALFLLRGAGTAWIPAFLVLYGISLGSELMGTTAGVPFGEYYYTAALGPRWLGHVPLVIPLSWFFMAVPSYALAGLGAPRSTGARVMLASLILLAWDLALDPAMSKATAYWVWARPGAYFGMPWTNLFGWYMTGLALMAALAALRAERWLDSLSVGWLGGFYVANLLLPVGMSAVSGLWGAVLTTIAVLGVTGRVGRDLSRRRDPVARATEVVA